MAEDPFTDADIALVLSGLPTSRAFAASDLYLQGRVDEVWVIPEPPNKVEGEVVNDQLKEELIKRGLLDPTLPQWAERILMATGVPKSKIVVLPDSANGTIKEAPEVRAMLKLRLPTRLVLVTSKSASRRARYVFRHFFKNSNVQVLSYPTPYDPFEPHRWWSQPRNALTVVMEYEKFLANIVTLAWGRQER